MRLNDALRSSLQSLVTNKLRSALTMLGVIIGVASVIAMVAVGNGASAQVQATILSLGSNLITVTPANLSDQGLKGAGASALSARSRRSGSAIGSTTDRPSCRAASSSASRSRERSSTTRR